MGLAVQENVDLVSEAPVIEQIISEGIRQPSPLLFMLHELQSKIGYISEDAVYQISEVLRRPAPEVLSIVTFHTQFKLRMKNQPAPVEARNVIRLCSGAPCYTKGSEPLAEDLCKLLDTQKGEVTKDKKFVLEIVDCLGACGMSPVMMINDDVHGKLTDDQLPGILGQYQ